MTDLMNKTFVANGGTTEDGKWRYEDANNLVTELENRITKPADPSHLDLLSFITDDWANVALSWAKGDLLYVEDNEGTLEWQRLPKGSDGQVLSLASGLPSWSNKTKDLFFARYGYTYWNVEEFAELDTPKKIIDDVTEYTTVQVSEMEVKSWGTLISLMGNVDYHYINPYISWETELRDSSMGQTATYSLRFDATSMKQYDVKNMSYTVCGSVATKVGSPTSATINKTIKLYGKSTAGGTTAYSRNNKVWITDGNKCSIVPSTITTSWLSTNGFSGIKYVELYDNNDSVKFNNDANLIYTGTAGQPVAPTVSSQNIAWDSLTDYEDITQVDIVSGNPLIVFEKA